MLLRSRRTPRARWLAAGAPLIAVLLLASSGSVQATPTPPRFTKKVFDLTSSGSVTLTKIHYTTPNEVRILTITPDANTTIDQHPATQVFSGYETVSNQADSVGAIAAINGDFAHHAYPTHWNEIDGELRTSGPQSGVGFAISKDETQAWAKHPKFDMGATTPYGSLNISHWNAGGPNNNEIVAYSTVGGHKVQSGTDTCGARLEAQRPFHWANAQHAGVSRDYKVIAQPDPCIFDRFPVGTTDGNVALYALRSSSTAAAAIKQLQFGDQVTLSWKPIGWKGALDVTGGQPLLVSDGKNVAPGPNTGPSYFYGRNPRTGIGINAGCTDTDPLTQCKVFFMTVDGRQGSTGWSVGMNLVQFADEFIKAGATWAINLDGGGGTDMWVKNQGSYCQPQTTFPTKSGCLVNRPSGGYERPVILTMDVLPGDDPGEGTGLAWRLSPLTSSSDPTITTDPSVAREALTDPGSTGGLFDAIAGGGLGPIPASPEFNRIVRIYRHGGPSG